MCLYEKWEWIVEAVLRPFLSILQPRSWSVSYRLPMLITLTLSSAASFVSHHHRNPLWLKNCLSCQFLWPSPLFKSSFSSESPAELNLSSLIFASGTFSNLLLFYSLFRNNTFLEQRLKQINVNQNINSNNYIYLHSALELSKTYSPTLPQWSPQITPWYAYSSHHDQHFKFDKIGAQRS